MHDERKIFFLSKYLFYAIFQASAASAHGVGSASRGSVNAVVPTKTPIKTTTDDTPDFDRSKVRLYIVHDTFAKLFFPGFSRDSRQAFR